MLLIPIDLTLTVHTEKALPMAFLWLDSNAFSDIRKFDETVPFVIKHLVKKLWHDVGRAKLCWIQA